MASSGEGNPWLLSKEYLLLVHVLSHHPVRLAARVRGVGAWVTERNQVGVVFEIDLVCVRGEMTYVQCERID